MSNTNTNAHTNAKTAPRVSLDSWAVLIALAAAILIRAGIIHRIPW
ncbi:MAG TPA: hypothetical protein VK805_20820 [Candidatus Baltobacteraceae bacterium]|nr:hypothetical protein [Candidatus Baltobacteraceae bacterium]